MSLFLPIAVTLEDSNWYLKLNVPFVAAPYRSNRMATSGLMCVKFANFTRVLMC